jgi:hypothetical protein
MMKEGTRASRGTKTANLRLAIRPADKAAWQAAARAEDVTLTRWLEGAAAHYLRTLADLRLLSKAAMTEIHTQAD